MYVGARARHGLILTIIQYVSATANLGTVNKPPGELSGMCQLGFRTSSELQISFQHAFYLQHAVCKNSNAWNSDGSNFTAETS